MLLCLIELLTFSLPIGTKSLCLLSIAGNALLPQLSSRRLYSKPSMICLQILFPEPSSPTDFYAAYNRAVLLSLTFPKTTYTFRALYLNPSCSISTSLYFYYDDIIYVILPASINHSSERLKCLNFQETVHFLRPVVISVKPQSPWLPTAPSHGRCLSDFKYYTGPFSQPYTTLFFNTKLILQFT